ncbi:MAG: DegV family protein [Clostridia bacterium]|nr:DegV family protein [Clostridia bacterium]
MRIITDSAADFTPQELADHDLHCVPVQVMFGQTTFTPGKDLTEQLFWQKINAGEPCKTSQPSPDAFLTEFEAARDAGEDAVCICISSALSGTMQSAMLARSMIDYDRIHIIDALNGAAAQKLLVLHACKLRDSLRHSAQELVRELEELRGRIRLMASLDTLDNLVRSGRLPRAAASIGTLTHLKPLLHVTPEGTISVCGTAFGRHRAIDSLAKRIAARKIDGSFPVIPFFSFCSDNCAALIRKLKSLGVSINEGLLSSLGPSIACHIGPNAYGVAFVEAAEG